jgi:hypothetical protein
MKSRISRIGCEPAAENAVDVHHRGGSFPRCPAGAECRRASSELRKLKSVCAIVRNRRVAKVVIGDRWLPDWTVHRIAALTVFQKTSRARSTL